MSSVTDTATAINKACRSSGGVYAQYSCKYVSWDDACRGTVGGGLSCWGANITDTYLRGRQGQRFFTVRSDNWDEKLGCVSSDKIAVVVGNHVAGGQGELRPITLRSLLKNLGTYGEYCHVPAGTDLSCADLDDKVSVRFQTTFLPLAKASGRAKLEFCTEAYNYNTMSDDDPRNLLVLASTQGIAIQQDGRGTKQILHHAVDKNGLARRYWLEAERSEHAVGGPQQETEEERADALARGKATAAVIGVPAMGTRFNALLTVQIPLKQQRREPPRQDFLAFGGINGSVMAQPPGALTISPMSMPAMSSTSPPMPAMSSTSPPMPAMCSASPPMPAMCSTSPPMPAMSSTSPPMVAHTCCLTAGPGGRGRSRVARRKKVGVSNAARVSRGTEAGVYGGLKVTQLERDPSQHITVTIVMYNTVAGGVPKVEDVRAAIDDMEHLYKACTWTGRLADEGADFMKKELTVKDTLDIQHKVTQQPYKPVSQPVANFDQFPTDHD